MAALARQLVARNGLQEIVEVLQVLATLAVVVVVVVVADRRRCRTSPLLSLAGDGSTTTFWEVLFFTFIVVVR